MPPALSLISTFALFAIPLNKIQLLKTFWLWLYQQGAT
jgi:hypothetical protein